MNDFSWSYCRRSKATLRVLMNVWRLARTFRHGGTRNVFVIDRANVVFLLVFRLQTGSSCKDIRGRKFDNEEQADGSNKMYVMRKSSGG